MKKMSKKELINACIDMSYNVSAEEIRKAIKEVSGQECMETKLSVKVWQALYEKLQSTLDGENGSKYLFCGSNVEHYRQK